MTAQAAELSQVTAAILAGGLGTRLRQVVADRPKVMAEINGRPFLAYLLDQLLAAGCRSAVLCTGYLGEQIEDAFGARFNGLELRYSREPRPLGTAGAVRLALPLLTSDPVLVMNGDSYCGADLQAYWRWFSQCRPMASLLLTEVSNSGRYGSVLANEDGHVQQFREKRADTRPGSINAGIYLFRREVIEKIPSNKVSSLEYDVFPGLVERGLCAFAARGQFLDIGTPEDFALAEAFLLAAQGQR